MLDELFPERTKRRIKDLNIVPILDMLTTVIFFLLMSTGFMEYTKLTVPPSSVSVDTGASLKQPLSPKILLVKNPTEEGMQLRLIWQGDEPGSMTEKIGVTGAAEERKKGILRAAEKLARAFFKEHPAETSLQVGLGRGVSYQDLISLMDGVRDVMSNIILISYREAEAIMAGNSSPETNGESESP